MGTGKVIDLTNQQSAVEEVQEPAVKLRDNEIDFIVTMIKSGRTLKEIGESILKIYKPKRERKPRKPKQKAVDEEIKMPIKPEKTPLRIMSESQTHERQKPDTNQPDSRPATQEKKEQLKESFVLPQDAENIIRILSQRLQNTVDVKIQYIVDDKRIIQVGATAPLYDRTIEKAHDELYVTVLKSLNSLITKTV